MMDYGKIMCRRVQDIQPSGIRKYFDLLQGMEGGISLGIGEPDFPTPWHIRDAGILCPAARPPGPPDPPGP